MKLLSRATRPGALILIYLIVFVFTSGCTPNYRAEENEHEDFEPQTQEFSELEAGQENKEQDNNQVKEAVDKYDHQEYRPVFEHNVRMNIDNAVQKESEDDWWDRF